jgi:isopentenyl-diphosphate Delta-isomerase
MSEIMIPAWVDGSLQPVEKLSVHKRGLRHKAVSVFVMDGDRLLLQRRALGKYHTPGLWANTCCTHPDWGEDDADCARRRLQEELGVSGLEVSYRGEVSYRADVGSDLIEDEVVAVFLGQSGPDLALDPRPEEVMDTRWIDLIHLKAEIAAHPDIFTPWLRIYMAQHAALIFGADD